VQRLKGIGVSPGIGAGPAVIFIQRSQTLRFSVAASRVPTELARLAEARIQSANQLGRIQARLPGGDLGALFEAQRLMLDDPMLIPQAEAIVRDQRVNVEWALQQVFEKLASVFDSVEDPYLKERKGDLADVVGRLRMNLTPEGGAARELLRGCESPCVLVADELPPSIAAQLDWKRIQAFVTDAGSRTYHTAILARSLHVPAVVGLHDATERIPAGAFLVVDGGEGAVSIDRSRDAARTFAATAVVRESAPVLSPAALPLTTADDVRIVLEANVDLLGDASFARAQGAEGIGLYRSELLLSGRAVDTLTEDAQYTVYRELLEEMRPAPVTIRTFDIDEDQLEARGEHGAAGWPHAHGVPRSRLGLRSIRLTLKRRELLRTQLRALLRAAHYGDLGVLFPFVSGIEEFREARAVLAEAREELDARRDAAGPIRVGVMIEVPSAALTADLLASESDFLAIGTNDLIQCCLAVDRTDDRVSHLYEPLHPAILRLIRHVARAAARRRRPLSVCGEMASDPAVVALLIGLGLRRFSMTPAAIPMAARVVRDLDSRALRRMASRALRLSSAPEIEQYVTEALSTVKVERL
jgi:phosphoenolpyruvate-protein phosphotransferase (PTS system enzyme I)